MPIVTLKEILKNAEAEKYGVGMFDVHNLEMVKAVIEAAEEENSPVIIALAEVHTPDAETIDELSNIIVHAAKKAKVPVCVHYDHAASLDNIVRVLHCGFSSVMYDGSVLPYEENVKNSKEAVHLASLFGASVETELGHVGGSEGGENDGHSIQYTDPMQANEFVNLTNTDALAVSIGTVHGVYRSEPKLDLERLKEIKANVSVPLVLHGGSGLSDDDFKKCIEFGISKINIYTEIVTEGAKAINDAVLNSNNKKLGYSELMNISKDAMKEKIKKNLRLFGSSNKA